MQHGVRICDPVSISSDYFTREVQAAYFAGRVVWTLHFQPAELEPSAGSLQNLSERLIELSSILFEQSTGSLRVGCGAIATAIRYVSELPECPSPPIHAIDGADSS